MNVGFYYHIEGVFQDDGAVRVPSHFGLLVEAIAREAGSVTMYVHSGSPAGNEDLVLSPPLVRSVDLGPARSYPARTFLPGPALRRLDLRDVDAMIVQGPTPLLPHLIRASGDIPVLVVLWSDVRTWHATGRFPAWRNAAIRAWARLYGWQQRRATRGLPVVAQNPVLADSAPGARSIVYTPFSSVRESDRIEAPPRRWSAGKGRDEPVRLLYSGRIVRDKGVLEAVEAVRVLTERGYEVELAIAGWEDPSDPTVALVERHARDGAISDRVKILGYRRPGAELTQTYADADIFVLPTYWDSLPRSMQEAMTMALPVVASRVGGIEHYLTDRETAMLVEPRRADQVADAIAELINEDALRDRVTRGGQAWAGQNTLEGSCRLLVGELTAHLERSKPAKTA